MNTRRTQAVTVLQAGEAHPTLSRLLSLQRASQDRMAAVQALIPAALRASVQGGPLDNGVWCLLLSNAAAAAKIRQLVPELETCLRSKNLEVTSIRLKVSRHG